MTFAPRPERNDLSRREPSNVLADGRLRRAGLLRRLGAVVATGLAALVAASPGSTTVTPVAASRTAKDPFIITDAPAWGSTWSYNPLSPDFLGNVYGFALLPLAVAKPTFGQYVPELATSWRTSPSKVTINLRRDATWQDGKPFTSTDVADSILIAGTDQNGIWSDITGLSKPNAHEVVLDVKPGISAGLVLYDALTILPVPAGTYGHFLPTNLQKDLLTYFRLSAKQPSAATKSAAGKAVAATFHRLEAYAPKRVLGDGPFILEKATLQSIVLKKWPAFWDASTIHVPEVEWSGFATNEDAYGALFSNRSDYGDTAMPTPIVDRYLQTSTNKLSTPPNFFQFSLYFNDALYPFTDVQVRQAFAYIINRKTVNSLSMGAKSPYQPVQKPDGLFYTINSQWLPAGTYRSLKPYQVDPQKAAAILRRLHFTKRGSSWYLPNGKRFSVTIDGPSGENDTDGQATAIAGMLNSFGIKAQTVIVSGATLDADWSKGNFQLIQDHTGPGTAPLAWPEASIGRALNFPNSGSYSGDRGIGFGPIETVPGLGKINVPQTLTTEDNTLATGSRVKKLTGIWAKFINSQLPFLSLEDKNVQIDYSTAHYRDWPPAKSALWTLVGDNTYGGLVVMMQKGYIRPHS